MLNNKKITLIFIVFFTVIFLFPSLVFAQPDIYGTNELSNAGVNLGTKSIQETITGIINIFLGLLGIIATVIILYGGFLWMTSKGNEDQITKAKKVIVNGVIGLIIILSSYGISRFLLGKGYDVFFGGGNGGSGEGGYHSGTGLGSNILESHYPNRNASDIPRNTNIYITFKVPMNLDAIIEDHLCNLDCISAGYFIELYREDEVGPLDNADLIINFDDDHKVFEINPYGDNASNHLGDPNGDIRYHMILNDWESETDEPAFPFTGYYDWYFTVSSELDLTPPEVDYVLPSDNSIDNPRNSIVQINFSEEVNPMFAVGDTSNGFNNITVKSSGNVVDGAYLISNQYRTVEFMTNDPCAQNSCGGDVYCLPIGSLEGNVTTNITDMAGNNLDPEYTWNFETNSTIDLEPPYVISMDSGTDLSLTEPISVTFNKNLSASTINSDNITLYQSSMGDTNFYLGLENSDTINIYHDQFDTLTDYTPIMNSGIKDLVQNCWYPCLCDPTDNSCSCNSPNCSGASCIGNDI